MFLYFFPFIFNSRASNNIFKLKSESLRFGKELNFDKAKSYAKSGAYFASVAEAVRTVVSYSFSMPCAEHF